MTDFVAENKNRFPVGALVCVRRNDRLNPQTFQVVRHTPKRIVIVPKRRVGKEDNKSFEGYFNADNFFPREVGNDWNELVPYTPEADMLEAIQQDELRMWKEAHEIGKWYHPSVDFVEEHANRLLVLANRVRETRQALEDYKNSKKQEK